jgi:hypothetical protein
VNWPEELFNDFYSPASGVEGTIAIRGDKLLINVWKCVAIEKTMDTEARGKYMLIIKDEDTANHKKEATATNTMNGSTRNLHLRP